MHDGHVKDLFDVSKLDRIRFGLGYNKCYRLMLKFSGTVTLTMIRVRFVSRNPLRIGKITWLEKNKNLKEIKLNIFLINQSSTHFE